MACLPLVWKLIELKADVNVITIDNSTPVSIAKTKMDDDNDEQTEARNIITNMLRHYGGRENYKDVLAVLHAKSASKREDPGPRPQPVPLKDIKEKRTLQDVSSRVFEVGGQTEIVINNKITQPVVE